MKTSEEKLIQTYLKKQGLYSGKIDGIRGKKTNGALAKALEQYSEKLPDGWQQWPSKRKAVAYLQVTCNENNIDAGKVDGWYGPQTESAAEQLKALNETGSIPSGFGDIEPLRVNPHNFPYEGYDSLSAFYGNPCKAKMVRVTCPWTLRLDWNLAQTTRAISIHEKLADGLSRILTKVHNIYGDSGIKQFGLDRYGGSYNCRKKRGSVSSWSTHAWGIAIDWYPSQNKLKWNSDRASLAHPDLIPWWEAWEKEGWLSLGRRENRDWMHVQAAKR